MDGCRNQTRIETEGNECSFTFGAWGIFADIIITIVVERMLLMWDEANVHDAILNFSYCGLLDFRFRIYGP
jgi:hypothetical protein